ncbi:MAG: polyphosphate polymerase domain-containing protein [Bacteroidales bacterium]|jgi:hypothetical protein|nr:polyphosphate polymerase domain-containing protein [Bacteroidales bacterium]
MTAFVFHSLMPNNRMKSNLNLIRKRYERKFVPETLSVSQVNQIILSLPSFFRPLYHPRYVNNLYLDSLGFDNYYDNVHGRSERKKVRIRWYGDLLAESVEPVLEIKIKSGFVGDKKQYKLPKTQISEIIHSKTALSNYLKKAEADLPADIINLLKRLRPSLLNRYYRYYFLDASGKYRITVDENVRYQAIHPNINFTINPKQIDNYPVVELKYDEQYDDDAIRITDQIPFRLTKNSKYVIGIEAFYPVRY